MMHSETSFPEAQEISETEARMILFMRVVLASVQMIIFIAPARLMGTSVTVSAILTLYALYSLVLYLSGTHFGRVETLARPFAHWVDIAWCTALVGLSGGVDSIFFIGFLFPMIVASFRWGFGSGLRVTGASALSFAAISSISLPLPGSNRELNQLLLRPIWLLGAGYMMAHWGGTELTLKGRSQLLKQVSEFYNPRFGIDRTLASLLQRLRRFYRAQSCLVVFNDTDGNGFRLQRTNAGDPAAAAKPEPVPPELARRLLELPHGIAAVHKAKPEGWLHIGRVYQKLDIAWNRVTDVDRGAFAALAATLDAKAFVTVPLQFRNESMGRLYVIGKPSAFVGSDMHFLHQIIEQVTPIIENIRLVEKLASHAADEERRRIARDIHDSVIQPYLGFQMGLAAIHQKAAGHVPELARQIEQLMQIADNGIRDLRQYVTGLKQAEGSDGGLLPALRRFADTFGEATGIAVRVETEGDIRTSSFLATELFQMVAEGLSNVRKHTQATRATIRLACRLGHLVLEIENERSSQHGSAVLFTPASIAERAAELGGKVRVKSLQDGGNSVVIDIPL